MPIIPAHGSGEPLYPEQALYTGRDASFLGDLTESAAVAMTHVGYVLGGSNSSVFEAQP